jgi:hypothetical protein
MSRAAQASNLVPGIRVDPILIHPEPELHSPAIPVIATTTTAATKSAAIATTAATAATAAATATTEPATATAESTAATAAEAAATAASARLALFSLIDAQRTAVEDVAVHLRNGFLCQFVGTHDDETETARTSSFSIANNSRLGHLTDARKRIAQHMLGG